MAEIPEAVEHPVEGAKAGASKLKDIASKRLGPLPAWGWGIVALGGLVFVAPMLRGKASGAGSSASGTPILGGGDAGAGPENGPSSATNNGAIPNGAVTPGELQPPTASPATGSVLYGPTPMGTVLDLPTAQAKGNLLSALYNAGDYAGYRAEGGTAAIPSHTDAAPANVPGNSEPAHTETASAVPVAYAGSLTPNEDASGNLVAPGGVAGAWAPTPGY